MLFGETTYKHTLRDGSASNSAPNIEAHCRPFREHFAQQNLRAFDNLFMVNASACLVPTRDLARGRSAARKIGSCPQSLQVQIRSSRAATPEFEPMKSFILGFVQRLALLGMRSYTGSGAGNSARVSKTGQPQNRVMLCGGRRTLLLHGFTPVLAGYRWQCHLTIGEFTYKYILRSMGRFRTAYFVKSTRQAARSR